MRIMLTSRQAMFVWWGKELINLHNDAYRAILGGKHPWALGKPASVVWQEIWDQVGPRAESAIRKNEGTYDEALLLIMERNGYPEETYYTFSYSPIPDDDGSTGGIICANTDDTQRMIGERQLALLRELAANTADARTFDEACQFSVEALGSNPYDLPFALVYLVDAEREQVVLMGSNGIDTNHGAMPDTLDCSDSSVWPIAKVLECQKAVLINDLASRFGPLPVGAWDRPPHQAVAVPIAPTGQNGKAGVLIVGLNPLRLFDDNYQGFLHLVASQIAASIGNAQAYEEERKRAESLAELDRAKILFFSNVSHEFRTPLTLMLSPTEELLDTLSHASYPDAQHQRESVELIHRNGLRLLKLVNTLLDFSRIEAGRVQAVYEPTDLSWYTTELASVFRSLVERAGMQLVVDCPPLSEPVYIDREMWEKIVLNLISNAFKFTFSGAITVRLQQQGNCVYLTIEDTGIGIPAAELPHLFERFHRVKNAQGRSFEGSGIGLSLVQELVRLHGGRVEVSSIEGEGTCFTISLPLGTAHLPSERIAATRSAVSTATGAIAYVEEAQRWLPESVNMDWFPAATDEVFTSLAERPRSESSATYRILLADDNADMREYVKRLLLTNYQVEAVANGRAALAAAEQHRPDLVLTDIMMPEMDGFELLRSLRSNPKTQAIPIILLSARAGEEARVEGLAAGADDYLIKPFSARELLARVEATLKLAHLRKEALQREQELRAVSETAQQQAEVALKRIDQLLESMSEAFVAVDRNWRIIYQNAAAEKINQKPRAEVLGKTLVEEWPANAGSVFEQQYQRAVREQIAVHFEQRYYEPPDHDVWLEVNAYPFDEGMGIFYRDISDRKYAESLIQQSEAQFRQLADAMPQQVWMTDSQGKTQYVNQQWMDYTGLTLEQTQDISAVRHVLHPEDFERSRSIWAYALASAIPYQCELRLKHREGETYRWFLSRAIPIYNEQRQIVQWFGTSTDIDDFKRAGESLRLLYETTSELLASDRPLTLMDNLFAKLSSQLDLHFYCNFLAEQKDDRTVLRLCNYAGLTPEQAQFVEYIELGQALCGLCAQLRQPVILNRDQLAVHPNAQLVCARGTTAYAGYPLIAQNRLLGSLSFASRTRAQFTPEETNLLRALCDQVAIALERSNLLTSIRRQAEQLQQANRIKDEFLAVLSHELRSPLNPILGWTKLLQNRQFDPARAKEALAVIERNAKLQAQLIDDLLDVSRIMSGKLSLRCDTVNLPFVISSALETVRLSAEAKRIQLETVLEPGAESVLGDAARLQQVIWNLLSNAIKFTLEGGRVEVRLEKGVDGCMSGRVDEWMGGRVDEWMGGSGNENSSTHRPAQGNAHPPIHPSTHPPIHPSTYAQITITDTGKGIKPEFLPHLFEYFRQEDASTTRRFGGLGLGLAIVRQLVELHGGTVSADSAGEGQGATFTVRLPLQGGDRTPIVFPAASMSQSLECPLAGVRVMVVDDDADTLDFYRVALESSGATVVAASSAVEAMQHLTQELPDVVLSDIGMSDINGYVLVAQIRELETTRGKPIPAIAITAYASDPDRQRALEAGFQMHLSKPIEPDTLVGAIVQMLPQLEV